MVFNRHLMSCLYLVMSGNLSKLGPPQCITINERQEKLQTLCQESESTGCEVWRVVLSIVHTLPYSNIRLAAQRTDCTNIVQDKFSNSNSAVCIFASTIIPKFSEARVKLVADASGTPVHVLIYIDDLNIAVALSYDFHNVNLRCDDAVSFLHGAMVNACRASLYNAMHKFRHAWSKFAFITC